MLGLSRPTIMPRRFKVVPPPEGVEGNCWLWQGSLDGKGYGKRKFRGKLMQVHVYMWQVYTKSLVPEGMELDHLCRRRNCANPDHLEAVSHAENVRRAHEGKRREGRAGQDGAGG